MNNVTGALTRGGYSVTYDGPTMTAVESFRELPSQGYNLIIIRAHQGGGQAIITSQPYSPSIYQSDQQDGALAAAEVSDGPMYFALTPHFVDWDMHGTFLETTIIVMGCAALQGTQELATAFIQRGANFFVGWDGSVTTIHTDVTTVSLVRQIANGNSIPDAIRIAGTADPIYGARLAYLDWSILVQTRIGNLVSQIAVWSLLASILVLGPLVVFVAPRLFQALDRAALKTAHRKKPSQSSNGETSR